jgi:hypothetical protein
LLLELREQLMELRPMEYLGQKSPSGLQRPAGYFECTLKKKRRAGAVGHLYAGGGRGHIAKHNVEREIAAQGCFNEFTVKDVALQSHHPVWKRVFDRLQVDPNNEAGLSYDPSGELNP